MATLSEAELAREAASEQLRQLGAHAISVEQEGGDAGAAAGYAVVAYFDHDPPASVPDHLDVSGASGATLQVPLRVNRSARFQLE